MLHQTLWRLNYEHINSIFFLLKNTGTFFFNTRNSMITGQIIHEFNENKTICSRKSITVVSSCKGWKLLIDKLLLIPFMILHHLMILTFYMTHKVKYNGYIQSSQIMANNVFQGPIFQCQMILVTLKEPSPIFPTFFFTNGDFVSQESSYFSS